MNVAGTQGKAKITNIPLGPQKIRPEVRTAGKWATIIVLATVNSGRSLTATLGRHPEGLPCCYRAGRCRSAPPCGC